MLLKALVIFIVGVSIILVTRLELRRVYRNRRHGPASTDVRPYAAYLYSAFRFTGRQRSHKLPLRPAPPLRHVIAGGIVLMPLTLEIPINPLVLEFTKRPAITRSARRSSTDGP